jgi:hypothetical protein
MQNDTTTWDDLMTYACVCDSSWSVGLAAGQTQAAEWFGADCSLRKLRAICVILFVFNACLCSLGHCPSGDDPQTTSFVETNCTGRAEFSNEQLSNATTYTGAVGASGNLCHVDCSNRGICDYSSGVCKCFNDFYGAACELTSALAENFVNSRVPILLSRS